MAGLDRSNEVLQFVLPSDVAGDRHDLAGQGGKFSGRRGEVLQLATGDDHGCPGLGEAAGDGLADAAAAAGDQGDLSLQ